MYKRFKDSIINPRQLLAYRNDKLLWVFLYLLFFALLLSTKTSLDVITYDGLSVASQERISSGFETIDPSCSIVAGVVACDTEQTMLFYEDTLIHFYIDSHDELTFDQYTNQYNIVFQGDTMYAILANQVFFTQKIADMPGDFATIDFALQTTDVNAFEDQIFGSINDYLIHYKDQWGFLVVAVDIISSILLFLFFILISAWMLKLRFRQVKFRQFFTMTVYSSTALYVILILNSLYNFNFIIIIILLIMAFWQNNQLSIEIAQRLEKKP